RPAGPPPIIRQSSIYPLVLGGIGHLYRWQHAPCPAEDLLLPARRPRRPVTAPEGLTGEPAFSFLLRRHFCRTLYDHGAGFRPALACLGSRLALRAPNSRRNLTPIIGNSFLQESLRCIVDSRSPRWQP